MTDLLTRTIKFDATRKAGLDRLDSFVPFAATTYRTERNFDYGPANRSNVSALSPWVRHRLLTEQEICARVMQDFALSSTEKFIQEVFWRTYWKGWLEMRPSVWSVYETVRMKALKRTQTNGNMRSGYNAAIEGNTGIDCFDAWAKELVETGYLHNHARMWFASIWIFTLRLDWTLGADFFLRHLMDADAASNTLSWRWVGGLQTKGKHYLARASNIHKFTDGRFNPQGLNEKAGPLEDDFAFDQPVPPKPHTPLPLGKKAMLLITEDDCTFEQLSFGTNEICSIATWNLSDGRSPLKIGNAASDFTRGALTNAANRACEKFGGNTTSFTGNNAIENMATEAYDAGAECVMAPFTAQGWARAPMSQLAAKCTERGIVFCEIPRDWDTQAWSHATKGFFPFKKQIPQLMLNAGFDIKGKR
ncbi:FAD-binding domain-containing protein [Pararhizobium sp. IMCC21322]|uniref:FAD-binding domain-containing protein n=1 Tax=Pararhizobium sp. IMCC21322 TaxID=3067903 RepID=UPI0027416279|nr:FAD-binding domain-containing protein [Pararhizobium sp. IMCC21322]